MLTLIMIVILSIVFAIVGYASLTVLTILDYWYVFLIIGLIVWIVNKIFGD